MTRATKQIATLCITLASSGVVRAAGKYRGKAYPVRGRASQAASFKADRVLPKTEKEQAHPLGGQRIESRITLNRDPTSGFYGTVNRPLREGGRIRLHAYVQGEALRRLLQLADGEGIRTLRVFGRQAGDWGREHELVPQWSDPSHPDLNRFTGALRFERSLPGPSVAEIDRTWQAIHREGAAFRVQVETTANRVVDIDMQRRGQNWMPGR